MTKITDARETLKNLLKQVHHLKKYIQTFNQARSTIAPDHAIQKRLISSAGSLIAELQELRSRLSPVSLGAIGITLGRSDSIAKFFAFSFTAQNKRPLDKLLAAPFYGAGVYAIYYHGQQEQVYGPLFESETPIYVGKANPKNPQAETVEEQGQALYARLKEHVKSIQTTKLTLADFYYRAAPIQTGMQAAVEEYMIRLFKPIWNKEIKVCFGIGKHGDSAKTRKNKRSPWDTMHPGRKWAHATRADQKSRKEIEKAIADHLQAYPPISDEDQLFKLLALK